jgi:hypothetical protein
MAWRWRRDHDIVRQRYVLDQSSSRGGLKPSQLCPLRTSISKTCCEKSKSQLWVSVIAPAPAVLTSDDPAPLPPPSTVL